MGETGESGEIGEIEDIARSNHLAQHGMHVKGRIQLYKREDEV